MKPSPKRPARPSSGSNLKDFCRALKGHRRFLLACHVMPEGDAVGSLYAMDSLLRRMGKQTWMVGPEPLPRSLGSVFPKNRWHLFQHLKHRAPQFDALVVTDCAKLERLGPVQDLLKPGAVIFNLDHHVSNQHYGHFNYVRPQASATGEVVYEVFKHLGVKVTAEEASYLYVAVATDTGSFRFSNTCARTHRLAAELIEKGIDVETINQEIHDNYSLNKIFLYSHLLKKIRTASGDRIAWVAMSRQDVKRYGAEYEDAEGFIDFLRMIRSVQVAFFASELPNEEAVRLSFRSKGNYDVQKLATFFGGGGHKKSSGCVFSGITLKAAVERVLAQIHQERA